jgi:hypothetical protein
MNPYPYSAPIILTDAIFAEYGGETGTASIVQRQNMFTLAEDVMSEALETYLLPTTVTGTYLYNRLWPYLILDNTWIQSINHVWFYDTKEYAYWDYAGTDNIYFSLRDDGYGLMDIHQMITNCHCYTTMQPWPYQIQVAYTAGLPTGTANQPRMLTALTEYAKIVMNNLLGYGNEAPADIGVQSFRNQQYSETRVKLLKTTFGSSPQAQMINRLIEPYKFRRWVGL